jgi:hypothetical protein
VPAPTRKKSKQDLHSPALPIPEPVLRQLDLSTSLPVTEETLKIPTREITVPARQRRAFDISKSFLASLVFTKVPWPATTEAELDLCKTAWAEACDSMTIQMRAIGALKPEDHIHNLPDGPSRAIDSISRGLVSFRTPTTIMTNLEHRI